MSNNLDNDRSQQSTGKLYPMDLAPKITIVKSGVANEGPKVITQAKGPGGGQITTHAVPLSLMRPNSQLVSQSVTSQMLLSRDHVSPLLGAHIISQGTQLQLSGQGSQIISQGSQIMSSQATQIVSQGSSNLGSSGGTGTTLISSSGNLRTIATGVRVLAPLSHSATTVGTPRPTLGVTVTSVSQLSGGGAVARGGTAPAGVAAAATSGGPGYHVPRGAAAVASLAVPRPAGTAVGWSAALVYAPRLHAAAAASTPPPAAALRRQVMAPLQPNVASTPSSNSVSHLTQPGITQRSYQPSKVLGVRRVLNNPVSSLTEPILSSASSVVTHSPVSLSTQSQPLSLSALPGVKSLECTDSSGQPQTIQIQVVSSGIAGSGMTGLEVVRSSPVPPAVSLQSSQMTQPPAGHYTPTSPARPSILRKRDIEGSPLKNHTPNAITALSTAINTLTAPSSGPMHHSMHPTNLSAVSNLTHVFNSDLRNLANVANSTDHRNPANAIGNNTSSALNSILAQQFLNSPSSPLGSLGSGSTTVSADSSPAPSPPPRVPLRASPPLPQSQHILNHYAVAEQQQQQQLPVSPRKKPRKQMLSGVDVRQCEGLSSPPAAIAMQTSQPLQHIISHPSPVHTPQRMPAPQRRALLGASWRGGGGAWRATARHFARPSDVRSAPSPRPTLPDPPARKKAAQQADGWKVHHLTATMDDLMELEHGVIDQLESVLHKLETRATSTPHNPSSIRPAPCDLHRLVELVKANVQRSRVVCDGIRDARKEVLGVFRHRGIVVDILTRQADKRCFKKHRN